MKIIKSGEAPGSEGPPAMFTGRAIRKSLLGPEPGNPVRVGLVRFEAGVRNRFHTHTEAQILFVVEGTGLVADETQEYEIPTGTLVYIPAGEVHWHGASAHSPMAHLTIGAGGDTQLAER
jgi:quercetin dioxygenase-like cupin family protein